jgi:SLOG in TRPM, prokaryote
MIHPLGEKFPINFSSNFNAQGLFVDPSITLHQSLQDMGLETDRPILVVIGGAKKLGPVETDLVRKTFTDILAPIAQKWDATVIDGGTNSGVMSLMGQARAALKGTFPLIGVVPLGLAIVPEREVDLLEDGCLEPNHTHFILVPGQEWGDESAWVAKIATELAGQAPSATVLINGGEITWKDAQANVDENRTLIVIEGTGRAADLLASVAHGHVSDERAERLLKSGRVRVTNLKEIVSTLSPMLETIFQDGGNYSNYGK